jgi:small subunit ribosomal protein S18b
MFSLSRLTSVGITWSLRRGIAAINSNCNGMAEKANGNVARTAQKGAFTALQTRSIATTVVTMYEDNDRPRAPRRGKSRDGDPEEKKDLKDRSRVIPLEVSLAYMDSLAYKKTYGNSKIWELYRRNFHKGKVNRRTRRSCIWHARVTTGNPCPVCRDEYLVVDYRNVKLISQFIDDYTGRVLTREGTGVCQHQWVRIRVELEKARDHGMLDVDPPFVEYDYDYYRPKGEEAEADGKAPDREKL